VVKPKISVVGRLDELSDRRGLRYSVSYSKSGKTETVWLDALVEPSEFHPGDDTIRAFLEGELANGPVASDKVMAAGVKAGMKKSDLFRVSKLMGILKYKDGVLGDGEWMWELPSGEERELLKNWAGAFGDEDGSHHSGPLGYFKAANAKEFIESQRREPRMLPSIIHWAYHGKVLHVELSPGHRPEDIPFFVKDYVLHEELEYEKLRRELETLENMDMGKLSGVSREPVPDAVRVSVWRRDQGQCVKCGSREKLEFDHIIPLAAGGSNTERNIQLLCETCNRAKGATI
jgi:hypothetical protein